MIIENDKPIKIIGYSESSLTDGALQWFLLETKNKIEIISPEAFLNLQNKTSYQYFVAFSLDMNLREKICNIIDDLQLDCITYIHDSCVVFDTCSIGKGVFIGSYSTIAYHTCIEDHCWIECNCLISHHVNLGKGCIIHGGSSIAGKVQIGQYSTLNFKSSVLNNLSVIDKTEIGAFSNVTKTITKPGRYVGSIARYIGPVSEYSSE